MESITFLEKYQPTTFNEVVGQKNIVKLLSGYVKSGNVPHLMFSGPPGTGKTTIARIIAHELYGADWKKNIIMLNSSSERGIDSIRGKIKDYTQYTPFGGFDFKLIFLDESDELTEPAQRALRETMLHHQNITRFIFAVNNINKVITPLQDRCQIFRFKNISSEDIKIHLLKISKAEKIEITDKNATLISVLAKGSMRRAINALQSVSVLDTIEESIIRELMDTVIDETHSEKLLKQILTMNVEKYEEYLFKLVYNNGFEPAEILQILMKKLMAANSATALPAILILAEYDYRIAQGASAMLQTRCALFKLNQLKTKEKIIEVL